MLPIGWTFTLPVPLVRDPASGASGFVLLGGFLSFTLMLKVWLLCVLLLLFKQDVLYLMLLS
jgi:hypothetical protein